MSLRQSLYFKSPLWLQQLMLTGYGLRLRYLRYGSAQRRLLDELARGQWRSAAEMRDFQLRTLNEVLRHARETVALYREKGLPVEPLTDLAQLAALPMVTKQELQAPRERVVSSLHQGRKLPEIHTGGTTGKPLTIYCDRETLQRNYAFFGRFRSWAGVRPDARLAVFAGRTICAPAQSRPPYWRRNPAANAMLFSSYHISPATLPDYVEALAAFAPEIIDSYPSSLEPVARWIVDNGVTGIRPRAIVVSSETLFPEARAVMEQAFGCRVFDHYGAAEMAALVTQCEHGSYHANPDFGVLEIIGDDGRPAAPGEMGQVVATGFINPVMPLVRYATGDLAVAARDPHATCACGRHFPIIERLVGRLDDIIVTPEGRRIGRLDPVFKAVQTLYETRIVQDRRDHVRVEVVLTGPFADAERASLLTELRNRLGPSMQIDIVEVDSIPRQNSGKLRTVVNLVDKPARRDA
jgi:phenylacetate-CoA ligase